MRSTLNPTPAVTDQALLEAFLGDVRQSNREAFLAKIEANPILATLRNANGIDALTIACEAGKTADAQALLPYVNAPDWVRLLDCACLYGHLACAQWISGYVDPKEADEGGNTALMTVAFMGHDSLLDWLLPLSDVRASDHGGNTALMRAASGRELNAVLRLLPHSDVQAAAKDGTTALMYAARRSAVECVRALLPHSQANARDDRGLTALENMADLFILFSSGEKERPNDRTWACMNVLATASSPSIVERVWNIANDTQRAQLPQCLAMIERAALQVQMGAKEPVPSPLQDGIEKTVCSAIVTPSSTPEADAGPSGVRTSTRRRL